MGAGLWSALLAALLHLQYIHAISFSEDERNNQIGSPAGVVPSYPARPAQPAHAAPVLCERCRAARNKAPGPGLASAPTQPAGDPSAQGKRKATLTINSFLSPSILPSLMKQIQSSTGQVAFNNMGSNDAPKAIPVANTVAAPGTQFPGGLSAKMTYFPNQLEPPAARNAPPAPPPPGHTSPAYPTTVYNQYSAPQALFQTLSQNPVFSAPSNSILSADNSTSQSPLSNLVNPNGKASDAPRIVFVHTSQPHLPPISQPSFVLAPQVGASLLDSRLNTPPPAPSQQQGPKSSFLTSMLPLLFGLHESGCGCKCREWHEEFAEPHIYGGYTNHHQYDRLTDLSGRSDNGGADPPSSEEASVSDYSSEETEE